MKDPNNKTISLYAIACVTVIAITAMLLTTVANAQVGQPMSDYGSITMKPKGLLHGNVIGLPPVPMAEQASRSFYYLVEKERSNSRMLVCAAVAAAGLAVQDSGSYGVRKAGRGLAIAASTAISIDGIVTFIRGRQILKGNINP